MAEKQVVITKKQHDAIQELVVIQTQASTRLGAIADSIIMGQDEDFPPSRVRGAQCKDGVYTLVLDVPDISPPQIAQEA